MTSTSQSTRFRPDSAILKGLVWRIALVIVSTAGVLVGLPSWARTLLAVAAALTTVLFFVRRYRRHGLLGGVLTALGFAVAALALLGLLLNVLPSGLDRTSWGLGVGIIELATLIALAWWRAPNPVTGRRAVPVMAIVWGVAVVVVLAGALLWSISSFTSTHAAPLAVSAVPSNGSVVVTVSSGLEAGPYELQLVTSTGKKVLANDVRVGPGNSSSITVAVPKNTRETIRLVRSGSNTTLRKLILDTTGTTTKGSR